MTLAKLLASKGWKIWTSPGDEYCLLYSVCSAWSNQVPHLPKLDTEHIKSKIFIETVDNAELYTPFLLHENRSNLFVGLRSYLISRHYNQGVGDIVLSVISNALNISLSILNEGQNNTYTETPVTRWEGTSPRTITIDRRGEHYSGVATTITHTKHIIPKLAQIPGECWFTSPVTQAMWSYTS